MIPEAEPRRSEAPSRRHPEGKAYGKAAKAGALWKFSGESARQTIEIPVALILARLLTPEDFGIAAASGFFLRLANKFGGFGIGGGALIRLKELRPDHVSSVFVLNLISGVILWLGITASAPALAAFFRNESVGPALRVGALVYLIQPFGVGQYAVMNRELRFKQIAFTGLVYPIVFLFVSVPMAFLRFGFWSLVYGQLCASLAQVLARMYFGRQPRHFKLTMQAVRETIPFGAGLSSKRLLSFGAEYLDSLIVGRLFGMTALGFYDKAFNTMSRFVDRLAFGPTVFLRIFSIIQDDAERFRRAYLRVMLTVTLLAFPPFAALITVAPQFIEVAFGRQWLPAVLPFQILCVAGALRLLSTYAGSATQAAGRIWSEVSRQVIYVILVVTTVLLLRAWGITGAAVGVSTATACMTLMMLLLASRITGVSLRDVLQAQLPGTICAAGLVLTLLATEAVVRAAITDPPAWQLLGAQFLPGALFYLGYVLYGPFRSVRDVADEAIGDFAPRFLKYVRRQAPPSEPPVEPAVASAVTAGERSPVAAQGGAARRRSPHEI